MIASWSTPPRRTLPLALLLAGAALAGCATTSPSRSVAGPAATPAGSAPRSSATSGGGCPVAEQTGLLRSNTLIDLEVGTDGLADLVTLAFGDPAPGPAGGTGRLRAVEPPFVEGGSGEPVDVLGAHHVELHLDGMLIADETGNATYRGETSITPNMLALRQVEMTEAFEGVYNFVVGYDGNGCVGLADDAAARTLTISIGR